MTTLVGAVGRRERVGASPAFNALCVVAGSAVVAGLAQLSVRLPFTPVPVTGQTLGVLLVAASLGATRGATSVALYLAEGALGLPVFAEGKAGVTYLVGMDPLHATGGYLWGFLAAAFVVGLLAQRAWDRRIGSALGAMLVGEVIVFTTGVAWLSAAVNVPAERALELGLYPFVVGEVVKLAIAAVALPAAWRLLD
jgi:biotin transport system substrate-specific component